MKTRVFKLFTVTRLVKNTDQQYFNKLVLCIFSAAIVFYTLVDLFLNLFETAKDFSKITSGIFQMKYYLSLIFSVILYLIMIMPLFRRRFEVKIIKFIITFNVIQKLFSLIIIKLQIVTVTQIVTLFLF